MKASGINVTLKLAFDIDVTETLEVKKFEETVKKSYTETLRL